MDIRVYAHHCIKPAAPLPPTSLTAGYPGWPQPTAAAPVPWPASGAAGPWVAWCELARRSDVHAARYAGPGWPGAPPPSPDDFYSDTAIDFSVTGIRILTPTASAGQHEYVFRDPSGAIAATIAPQIGNAASFAAAASVPSGRGLWTIEIRRVSSSAVTAPSPLVGPPPVEEPLVGMFGPDVEGLLLVQFSGNEITTQPCPTDVTLTAEAETTPGSGRYRPLSSGDCVEPGTLVRFTASIVPAGSTGVQYQFDFGDGNSAAFSAANTATHTYAQPSPGITCTVTAWIPNSPCFPRTKSTTLVLDCCARTGRPSSYWDPTQGKCVACPSGLTVAAAKPSGCAPGSVGVVALTATPPAGLPPGATYHWTIDGPMSQPTVHASRSGSGTAVQSNTGWSGAGTSGGAVVFAAPGIYSVSVSVQFAGAASQCSLQASTSFAVDPCSTCPAGQHWDAAQGKCVGNDPTPTSTPTPTEPPHTTPTPTTPPGPGGPGSGFCGALLVIALILLLVGGALIIAGVCLAVVPLTVAGAIVAGLGALAFIAWAIFCSRFTACSLMQEIHCILFWIIAVVGPVLTILGAIFGGLACALAAAGSWAGWGFFFAWLGRIMMLLGCPRRC